MFLASSQIVNRLDFISYYKPFCEPSNFKIVSVLLIYKHNLVF